MCIFFIASCFGSDFLEFRDKVKKHSRNSSKSYTHCLHLIIIIVPSSLFSGAVAWVYERGDDRNPNFIVRVLMLCGGSCDVSGDHHITAARHGWYYMVFVTTVG
ncbi:hypothetical protein Tco_0497770 [Tanacetum coccineum]